MRRTRSTAALAMLATMGCSAAAALDPGGSHSLGATGSFTTDSLAYTSRPLSEPWPGAFVYGFTVVTRYTNPTRDPVYLWTCYPNSPSPMYGVVQASETASIGIAYNGAWACVGHDRPIEVKPGETRVDTIRLRGPNAFDGITHKPIEGILEGRFRMRFPVQSCRTEGGCRIDDDALTHSNEFTVRLGR
ncbi:MAG TPA: hypothetical protein VGP25_11505 [Gemmatimonadaceae bacterium]|nr:hypothetical protein [Gemmatimonadaceae bacterium]